MSIDVANDEFYTQAELCARLRIGRTTFSNAKKAGNVPKSIKMMGKTLYPSSEVNKFIKEKHPDLWVDDNKPQQTVEAG